MRDEPGTCGGFNSLTSDGELRQWEVLSGNELPIKSPQFKDKEGLRHAENYARSGVFSPDRRRLAVLQDMNECLRLADLATGHELLTFPRGAMATFSPDGTILAVVRHGPAKQTKLADGRVYFDPSFSVSTIDLLDATTGKERLQITLTGSPVQAAAFSPDGSALATASGRTHGEVHLFRVADGSEILKFETPTPCAMGLSFTPDGRGLATGLNDTSVLIWDLARLRANVRK